MAVPAPLRNAFLTGLFVASIALFAHWLFASGLRLVEHGPKRWSTVVIQFTMIMAPFFGIGIPLLWAGVLRALRSLPMTSHQLARFFVTITACFILGYWTPVGLMALGIGAGWFWIFLPLAAMGMVAMMLGVGCAWLRMRMPGVFAFYIAACVIYIPGMNWMHYVLRKQVWPNTGIFCAVAAIEVLILFAVTRWLIHLIEHRSEAYRKTI